MSLDYNTFANLLATDLGTNVDMSAPNDAASFNNVDDKNEYPSEGIKKTVSILSLRRRLVKAI